MSLILIDAAYLSLKGIGYLGWYLAKGTYSSYCYFTGQPDSETLEKEDLLNKDITEKINNTVLIEEIRELRNELNLIRNRIKGNQSTYLEETEIDIDDKTTVIL